MRLRYTAFLRKILLDSMPDGNPYSAFFASYYFFTSFIAEVIVKIILTFVGSALQTSSIPNMVFHFNSLWSLKVFSLLKPYYIC